MEERSRTILLWTMIALLCFVGIPIHLRGSEDDGQILFQNFTQTYNKSYGTMEEREGKWIAFQKSLAQIRLLNSKQGENLLESSRDSGESHHHRKFWMPGMAKHEGEATWGVTPFADMSPDEFQRQYLDPKMLERVKEHRKNNPHHKHGLHGRNKYENDDPSNGLAFDNLITRKKRAATNIPNKVDWRTKGVITKVKHQKACGACWAFSTIETVESMQALKNGPLEDLSVQQVIDCSKNGNMGCSGGDTCTAIQWMTGRSLATEKEYPLTLRDETCLLQSAGTLGVRVNSNFSCSALDGVEDELVQVLATHGPVTVAVDATNWQFYVGGVIQFNCDTRLNHAVQIVGYDKNATTPYYIVRNSWGTTFGDNGYLYVAIGKNLCGIASHVAWLSVA